MNHAKRNVRAAVLSTSALVAIATLGGGAVSGSGPGESPITPPGQTKTVTLNADLTELNDSGVSGSASAVVRNQLIRQINVDAVGLAPDLPHAQHIHYGDDALNECPTLAEHDSDSDGLLSTVEGLPAYGPIVVSLTTSGGTTPASGLAVSRFPTAPDGELSYSRSMIEFTAVSGTGYTGGSGTAKQIADAIRDGEGVVVIHGVDHDGNGVYDGDARSELDPSLPREATDPAACGILK